jgi:hypothetical protein
MVRFVLAAVSASRAGFDDPALRSALEAQDRSPDPGAYAASNGTIARSVRAPRMLRESDSRRPREPLVHVYPPGHGVDAVLEFVANARDRILERN